MRLNFEVTASTYGEIQMKAEEKVMAFIGDAAGGVVWSAEYDCHPIETFQGGVAGWRATVDATVVKRSAS